MRRALDQLVPGGVGVFLIPAGLLSGNLNRGLREKLLCRHHLLGAFRLPSHDRKGRETVPGASVVMGVVFWRSRGGELSEVDPADEFILDGEYFQRHLNHILGQEDGAFAGDDEAGMARSWRYKVTGDFSGLPALTPRPVCTTCASSSSSDTTCPRRSSSGGGKGTYRPRPSTTAGPPFLLNTVTICASRSSSVCHSTATARRSRGSPVIARGSKPRLAFTRTRSSSSRACGSGLSGPARPRGSSRRTP